VEQLYTWLLALSVTLINPWGASRGQIWTQPKFFILLLLCVTNLLALFPLPDNFRLTRPWRISCWLWQIFLGIGLLASFNSPFPGRSFLGQEEMGDGWLYWLVVAVFTLSNSLLLQLYPQLARAQFKGILIGGAVLAASMFPQVINWRIDYTATTGQLLKDHILVSSIFQDHQPIGLYSHRGHAGIVLSMALFLGIIGYRQRWLKMRTLVLIGGLMVPALLLTKTRAIILAVGVAIAYLFSPKYPRIISIIAAIGLAIIVLLSSPKKIANLPLIKQITSDRIYLWELAVRGIQERPLWGWGFDGFGIAYPHILNQENPPTIVNINDLTFTYINVEGERRKQALISNKAHNLFLDVLLSVGWLGMGVYALLLGFYCWQIILSPFRGVEAVTIAYLVFGLTWFECAQYSHLIWWSLSLAIAEEKNNMLQYGSVNAVINPSR